MTNSRERDKSVERLLRQSRLSLQAPGDVQVTDSCLDGETLAAWADGGLSGAALEMAESHVADCARCQALVGTFARVNATVPPVESEHAARGWLTWLVPLTAAAVAVAVWVAVPRHPTERLQEPASVQEEPASVQEDKVLDPAAGARDQRDKLLEPAAGVNDERMTPAPVLREGPTSEVAQELRRDQAPASAAEAESLSKQAQAAPAARAPAAATSSGTLNTLDSRDASRFRAEMTDRVGIDIVSPDPMVRWRIAGSSVQRSSNGGAAWEATPTGIATELTAGAAPSPLVCWIVGRGGVVLVSIDGRTWRRVPFPEATDLSGVRARDARAASVTTADARVFSTTDAGMSWVPGPLQDF